MARKKQPKKTWLDALDEDYQSSLESSPVETGPVPQPSWDKTPLTFVGYDTPQTDAPQTRSVGTQQVGTPAYKRGFIEDLLLSDNPTTGLGLAVANLFANRQAANASNDLNAALADQLTPKEDIELQKLQTQLDNLRAGKAKKLSVVFGPGEMGKPYYVEEDYTPQESKALETKLLSDIGSLQKRIASGEFSRAREQAAAKAAEAEGRLKAAQQVAAATKQQLAPTTELFSRNIGQGSTLENVAPTAGSLVGGGLGALLTGTPAGAAVGSAAGASLGAVPAAKAVYNQSLVQAMLPPEKGGYGATYEEAVDYALGNTAIEFGSEALGGLFEGAAVVGKKALSALGGSLTKKAVKDQLIQKIRSRTARTLAATGVEYGTELAGQAGQVGFDALLAQSSDFGTAAGREVMKQNVQNQIDNAGSTAVDTLIQTALIAGPAASVGAHAAYKQDLANQAKIRDALTSKVVNRGVADVLAKQQPSSTVEPAPPTNELALKPVQEDLLQEDLFPDLLHDAELDVDPNEQRRAADLKAAQERIAWNQRNKERAAEIANANARNGLVAAVDNAISKVEELRSRVEDGDTSSGTLNSLAAAQREQRVAQAALDRFDSLQQQPEPTPTVEQTAEPEQLSLGLNEPAQPKKRSPSLTWTIPSQEREAAVIKEATSVLNQHKKNDNKLVDTEFKRLRAERAQRRNAAMMAAAEATRGKSNDERLAAIAQAAREFDAANPEVTRDQINLDELLARQKQPKQSSRRTTSAPAPVAESAVSQTASVEQSAPTSEIGKRVAQLADKLRSSAMAMEAGDTAGGTAAPKFDRAAFTNKVSSTISNLFKHNSDASVDVLNMLDQDKLRFAPNAESVGLDVGSNAKAAYRMHDGKMYLFTDHLDPKDAVAAIIAGYHEGTHYGQHSESSNRGNVMASLLGDKKYGSSVKKVLAAAEKGNTVAKRAVATANVQVSPEERASNPALYEKELMAHFVGEVMRARSKPLGSVAGVARDILAGARNAVRNVTGVNLDVSFNDIYAAAKNVGKEVLSTDHTQEGPVSKDALAMIYNVRDGKPTPGQERAIKNGYVYDSVDGTRKYVLSDSDASMSNYQYQKLIDSMHDGEVPLSEIMDHDVLYRERPDAADVKVVAVDNLGPNVYGSYDPDSKTIYISSRALRDGKERTLDTLLHEAQHHVQNTDGRAHQFFRSDPDSLVKKAKKKLDYYSRQNELAANSLISAATRHYRGTELGADIVDVLNKPNASPALKARMVAELLRDVTDMPSSLKKFYDDYMYTRDKHTEALANYGKALDVDYAKYRRNITEKEAFFTQRARKATQDQLDKLDVENAIRYQDVAPDGTDITEGKLDVPNNEGVVEVKSKEAPDKAAALAMADTAPEGEQLTATPVGRWLPSSIRSLFDATHGLGKAANESIEHAMDSPAGKRMQAEAHMGRYDSALVELAAERGMTPEELNRKIEAELNAIPDDIKGYDANIAAFNKVVEKYGAAGEALKDMRDLIDSLSLQVVEDRLSSSTPLSSTEQKLYQAIIDNMGRYTTRQYAAYAGKAGTKYSKAVWSDYAKRKKAGKFINDVIEENYKKVANAIDVLVNDNLYVPEKEGLAQLDEDRVRSLYNTWIGNPENVPLQDMRDQLLARREEINRNRPELEKHAEAIVRQLLGLTKVNEPLAEYYRGAKRDNSILRKRSNIAPELRTLMGEITDPAMSMLMTTAKLAEFTSKTRMFLELANNMEGDILPPTALAPDNWVTLSDEGYGPLRGYKVSPNMEKALTDVTQIHATFEQAVAVAANQPAILGKKLLLGASDAWSAMAKVQKGMKIVGNPANLLVNFAGGGMIMLQNGNINPKYFVKGLLDAKDLIMYAMNPKAAKSGSMRLVENGVVDSAFVGEIKAEQFRELNNLIKDMSGRGDSEQLAMVKNFIYKALAGGRETYAMADVLYKIANFHHQVDHLKAFYEAEGVKKTAEEIDREAANDVRRTNFTYRRAAPLVKALEQRGFTMFGPYMAEVFRTQISNMLQGIGEIKRAGEAKTAEGKNIMLRRGLMRIGGQLLSYGLVANASRLMASAFGEDDEEQSLLRSLLPEYLRDQDFGIVGLDDNGYPLLYQFSKFDPVGPVTDLIRAAVNGDNVTVGDVLAKLKDTYVTPTLFSSAKDLVLAATADKAPSKKPLVQQVDPEFYSNIIDIANSAHIDRATVLALTNFGEAFFPGFMLSWRQDNARPAGDSLKDSLAKALSYIGFRFVSLDPAKPLNYAARNYTGTLNSGRQELMNFFSDSSDRTQLEVEAKLARIRKDEYDAFNHLTKVVKAAKRLGQSNTQTTSVLKNAGLNLSQLRNAANGTFRSEVVSSRSLDTYMQKELDAARPEDRPAIRQKWKAIKRSLMDADKILDKGSN